MAGPPGTLVGRLRVKVLPDTSTFGADLRRQLADEGKNDVEVDVKPVINQVALRRAELQLDRLARTRFAPIVPVGNGGDQNRDALDLLQQIATNTDKINRRVQDTTRSIDRVNDSLSRTSSQVRDIDRVTSSSSFFGGRRGGISEMGSVRALDPTRLLILAILALSPALVAILAVAVAQAGALATALTAAAGGVGVLALGFGGLIARFKQIENPTKTTTGSMHDFAHALEDVKEAYSGFLDEIQEEGFATLAQGLGIVSRLLPRLVPIFRSFNKVLQESLAGIDSFLGGSEGQRMLDFFETVGAVSFDLLLDSLGNLLKFFGRLGEALGPFAIEVLENLADATARWADSVDGLADSPKFQAFLTFVRENGPKVYDAFIAMRDAITEVALALAPLAGPVLDQVTKFFRNIADTDPAVIQAVAVGLSAALVALLGISAVLAIAALANPAIGIAAVLVGVSAAAATFVANNPETMAQVQALYDKIKDNETVQTAIGTVETAFADFFANVKADWEDFKPTLKAISTDLNGAFADAGPSAEANLTQLSETTATGLEALSLVVDVGLRFIENNWIIWGDSITIIASGALKAILLATSIALGVLETIFIIAIGVLTGDWDQMKLDLGTTTLTMWTNINKLFSTGLDTGKKLVNEFVSSLPAEWEVAVRDAAGAAREMMIGFRQELATGIQTALKVASSFAGDIKDFFDIDLTATGRTILKSLADGISEGIENIRELLQGLTEDIPTWKGPMSVDRTLLTPNADAIMDSFTNRIESRLAGVRGILGGLGLDTDIGLNAGSIAAANAPQVNVTVSAANEQQFVANVADAAQKGAARASNLAWRRV